MIVKDFLAEATSAKPYGVHLRNFAGETLFEGTVEDFLNSQYGDKDVQSWNWEQYTAGLFLTCRM